MMSIDTLGNIGRRGINRVEVPFLAVGIIDVCANDTESNKGGGRFDDGQIGRLY